ncbi:MAG: SGNH/GDSL hydrolase family protein [Pseudomonadota bacterium]
MRWILFILWALTGAGAMAQEARIAVLGDSVMAWNGARSVADVMEEALGEPVRDASVSGAQFAHRLRLLVGPMDIRAQLPAGSYDWLVLTGGANDLAARCNCAACGETLDALIGPEARLGAIPDFLEEARARGAWILWAGYYDTPAGGGPFSGCEDAFAVLDSRLARLAEREEDFLLADLGDVIDAADPDHYDPDRVHPSPEGSRLIGLHLARIIADLAP